MRGRACVRVSAHVSACARVRASSCVCMRAYVRACVCACVRAYVYMCVFMGAFVCAFLRWASIESLNGVAYPFPLFAYLRSSGHNHQGDIFSCFSGIFYKRI